MPARRRVTISDVECNTGRIVVDTGAAEHIHPDADSLINTSPSDVTFVGMDGGEVEATVVGDLPLRLVDHTGSEFDYLLRRVHAAPAFAFTLFAWGPLESIGGALHLENGKRYMTLPGDAPGDVHTVVPETDGELYVLRGRIEGPGERRHAASLAALRHPHTGEHLRRFDRLEITETMFRRFPVSSASLQRLSRTAADAPPALERARGVNVPDATWSTANAPKAAHTGTITPSAPRVGAETLLDAAGPFRVKSKSGFKYFYVFVDGYSDYTVALGAKDVSAATLASLVHAYRTRLSHAASAVSHDVPDASGLAGDVGAATVRLQHFHGDKGGAFESDTFFDLTVTFEAGSSTAPRESHDLNPRAERKIRAIVELVRYMLLQSGAPPYLWEYAVEQATLVLNSTCGVRNPNRSPVEIVTGKQPQILRVLPFGCAAVITKTERMRSNKLAPRGSLGIHLGLDPTVLGGYAVYLLEEKSVVVTCDVRVDEFAYPLAPQPPEDIYRRFLTRSTRERAGSATLATRGAPPPRGVKFVIYLFSGPYDRPDGVAAHLAHYGIPCACFDHAEDPRHDIFLDEFLETEILGPIAAGNVVALIASPKCAYYSISRWYSRDSGGDLPPPLFSLQHPDGIPESELPPAHVGEQRRANAERARVLEILELCIAHNVSFIVEHPAPRCVEISGLRGQFDENGRGSGSLFITSGFRRLYERGTKLTAFAQCEFGASVQKYTAFAYYGDVGRVVRQLNGLSCGHDDHVGKAAGRDSAGAWRSRAFAAWPPKLNAFAAYSIAARNHVAPAHFTEAAHLILPHGWVEPAHAAPRGRDKPTAGSWETTAVRLPPSGHEHIQPPAARLPQPAPQPQIQGKGQRAVRESTASTQPGAYDRYLVEECVAVAGNAAVATDVLTFGEMGTLCHDTSANRRGTFVGAGRRLPAFNAIAAAGIAHDRLPPGLYDRNHSLAAAFDQGLWPLEGMILRRETGGQPRLLAAGVVPSTRDPKGHKQAMAQDAQRGDSGWLTAEYKELGNHSGKPDDPEHLSEFLSGRLTRQQCIDCEATWYYASIPEARALAREYGLPELHINRAQEVYTTKRTGKRKARICMDGSGQTFGVDYNQTFQSVLRMDTLRVLLSLAARRGLRMRRRDLVAAFLQGCLEHGEIAFMYQPAGHVHAFDERGKPKICVLLKPLYGMKQAGRRFQRDFYYWLTRPRAEGGAGLIQSQADLSVFYYRTEHDEFLLGVYVDDLIMLYPPEAADDDGTPVEDSIYGRFIADMDKNWKSEDEGELSDILNIQVTRRHDGSVHVSQEQYARRFVEQFHEKLIGRLRGPPPVRHANMPPHTPQIAERVLAACDDTTERDPADVHLSQCFCGVASYLVTNTRCDGALAFGLLCRCMAKPTDDIFEEMFCFLEYFRHHPHIGLTYEPGRDGEREGDDLVAMSDASWETRKSTSGWIVLMWQATVHWRSVQQPSIALSSCQSEIMAASEATKDVLSYRRLRPSSSRTSRMARSSPPQRPRPPSSTVTTRPPLPLPTTPRTTASSNTSSGGTSSSARPLKTPRSAFLSSAATTTSPTSSRSRSSPSASSSCGTRS